jgi:hypothetical protein
MATCCGYQSTSPHTSDTPINFWRGLSLGLSIWVVLIGALVIA